MENIYLIYKANEDWRSWPAIRVSVNGVLAWGAYLCGWRARVGDVVSVRGWVRWLVC